MNPFEVNLSNREFCLHYIKTHDDEGVNLPEPTAFIEFQAKVDVKLIKAGYYAGKSHHNDDILYLFATDNDTIYLETKKLKSFTMPDKLELTLLAKEYRHGNTDYMDTLKEDTTFHKPFADSEK